MATPTAITAPFLPSAPVVYDARYVNLVNNTQRVFSQAVTNALVSPSPHGGFYSTTTQTNPVSNTPNTVACENVALATSVALTQIYTRLSTLGSGTYRVTASVQAVNSGAGGVVYLWFRKNGLDIVDSVVCDTHAGSSAKVVVSTTILVQLGDRDYIECMWASDSTSTSLTYTAASGLLPAIPSCKIKAEWVTNLDLR